jgi:hypothetical protein
VPLLSFRSRLPRLLEDVCLYVVSDTKVVVSLLLQKHMLKRLLLGKQSPLACWRCFITATEVLNVSVKLLLLGQLTTRRR